MASALLSSDRRRLQGRRTTDHPQHHATEIDFEHLFGKALLESGMTRYEAASLMQMDESQLSKALRAQPHHSLCLRKLMRLPHSFQAAFLLDLMHISLKRHAQALLDEVGVQLRRRA